MLPRPRHLASISRALAVHPVAALLGPRQCGKTTLARLFASAQNCTVFDLENPVDLRRLSAPNAALAPLDGLVIIDEVQRQPELFELLRVLVDRPDNSAQFLLLGSAAPELVRRASESLAGRIGFVDLGGFALDEVGSGDVEQLWQRGGFPRAFLADDDGASLLWRNDFMRTFLERDIPQLGISVPAVALRRFWTMVAHYHGQVWNAAEFARSLGSAEATARRYLDILTGSYVVRQLVPWHANIKKRQVKAPKIYVRDTGLLHALLSLENLNDLRGHPKLGASWEGFVVEQLIGLLNSRDVYYWATHAGAELDLLTFRKGKAIGFEVKYSDAPRTSKSMRVAMEDLALEQLYVIYPGSQSYALDDKIEALAIGDVVGRLLPSLKRRQP